MEEVERVYRHGGKGGRGVDECEKTERWKM